MMIVYNASTVGSVAGGWLSGSLINRGWTINRGAQDGHADLRAVRGAGAVRAVRRQHVGGGGDPRAWRMAAHQGWSANLFTTTSDMFPRVAVGSVVGIGAAAGALGNALMLKLAGLGGHVDGQLLHPVHDLRFGVPGGAGDHAPALAEARTGEAGLTV